MTPKNLQSMVHGLVGAPIEIMKPTQIKERVEFWSRFLLSTVFALQFSLSSSYSYEAQITSFTASSALSGWPLTNAFDGSQQTAWSSVNRPNPNAVEHVAFWFSGFTNINYVRLAPRFNATNQALGFPVSFHVCHSDGSAWITNRTVTGMHRPYRNAEIILALPTVNCNGILVQATTLGNDLVGNNLFQLAEIRAGYDSDLANRIVWSGVSNLSGTVEMRNVGARQFDPQRLANWHFDARNPILQPKSGDWRNIYAAFSVANGLNTWNVYFGGWDGVSLSNDAISLTVTSNRFDTFGPHQVVIDSGPLKAVNNESVVKVSPTNWVMTYTTLYNSRPEIPTNTLINKPSYAVSTNGVNWTPSIGDTNFLVTMSGYPNWSGVDANGMNALYHDGSLFHLYFGDLANFTGVQHATSLDGHNFTYEGAVLNEPLIVNDVKRFSYLGNDVFIWAYHLNTDRIYYSLGTNLSHAGPSALTLFTNHGPEDRYIVSGSFVREDNKLLGCLFGAGATTNLMTNQIYARWLQREVVFTNSFVRWGDTAQAVGPDKLHLYMSTNLNVETGQFEIYAEDGVTLEYRSPLLTILPGDVWQVIDPLEIAGARMIDPTRFEITLRGPVGRPYRLLAATNAAPLLHEWTQLTNGVFSTGAVPFTDDQVTNYPTKCYRIVSP